MISHEESHGRRIPNGETCTVRELFLIVRLNVKSSLSLGPIVHVNALGQNIIILNDARYAVDLFDKKGALYSDRPTLIMAGHVIGWDEGPGLCQMGERWTEYRRLFSQFMGTKAKVEPYDPVIQAETNVFLKNLLVDPQEWVEHARRFATSLFSVRLSCSYTCSRICSFAGGIVHELTYGYNTSDPDGLALVKLVDDAMEGFAEATKPSAFLLDAFPFCTIYSYPFHTELDIYSAVRAVPSWLPGAGWKRKAMMYRDCVEETLRVPFELVKRQMVCASHLHSKTRCIPCLKHLVRL